MTTDDNKLIRFFDTVIRVLWKKCAYFHWPETECFEGSCSEGTITITHPLGRGCNWKALLELSAWFLKRGPNVDDNWKQIARKVGCNPESFHELLLGVFIGGDGAAHPWYAHPGISTAKDAAVLDAALKAEKEFSLRIAKDLEPKETP